MSAKDESDMRRSLRIAATVTGTIWCIPFAMWAGGGGDAGIRLIRSKAGWCDLGCKVAADLASSSGASWLPRGSTIYFRDVSIGSRDDLCKRYCWCKHKGWIDTWRREATYSKSNLYYLLSGRPAHIV